MSRQQAEDERVRRQKQIVGMFHRVFDGPDGKELMDWFSIECMEHQQTYVPGSVDQSAFNEGKRHVIRRIRAILEVIFK